MNATRLPLARRLADCHARLLSSTAGLRPVRGMPDTFGDELRKSRALTDAGRRVAELYGCEQIATPVLEHSALFERSLGASTDVVGKELFSFVDKGEKAVSLRPEGTAGVARAVITNNMLPLASSSSSATASFKSQLRLYYHGPMFRRERPQKGRLRQFEQFGVEVYGGVHSPSLDAEVILMARRFLDAIHVGSKCELRINTLGSAASQRRIKDALREHFRAHSGSLSADSVRRIDTNPLRILDSKAAEDQPAIGACPSMFELIDAAERRRFESVLSALDRCGVKYAIDPLLVRGLDYYRDTVWEFVATPTAVDGALGPSQSTVLAGGRYDGLIPQLLGSSADTASVPSIGWAAGIERLRLIAPDSVVPRQPRPVVVIPAGDSVSSEVAEYALQVAECCRASGHSSVVYHLDARQLASSPPPSLKKILTQVLSLNPQYIAFVSADDAAARTVSLRNADTREQQSISLDSLAYSL